MQIKYIAEICCGVADADKDDTGRYKVEVSNDSGTGTCEIPVKVKGQQTVCFLLSFSSGHR